jgi:1-deoxy-D-xylulose-5-phosphate synthase
MAPKDENELRNMLYTAINFPGPIAIRYPRGNGYGVDLDTDFHLVENKIELLRPGRDLALIAIGSMVYPASEAAQILANEGIEVAVINARYIKPLDKDGIINIAKKIGRIITIEENTLLGGFGSSVLELLSENGLSQCILDRLGIPDYFIEHGDRFSLLEKCGLTANIIVQKVKSYLNKEDIKHNYYVKASK